jgi:hypothetical protein
MTKTVDDHQQDINDPRVLGTRLGGTTMTDDMVKEIIAKAQECGGAMTSDQLLKVIKGNQGEDGRVKKYKDEGAGLGGMVKGGGAGLDVTVKGAGMRRDHCSEDIDTSYSYPLVNPRLVEAHDDGTVVQSTGADRSPVQPLDVMINPAYSQHLKGDRNKDDRNKNSDRNREDDRIKDDRNKEGDGNKSKEKKDEGYKDEDEGAGWGEAHKDGGAGLDDKVKGEGAGHSRGVKRSTRRVKVNMGGEELNLYRNTGTNITIITPAMYRQNMGKVVAAKRYLRARGSSGYLDTKGMVKTTLTAASGGSKRTWVYVVAGARPEAILGDHDAEDLCIVSSNLEGRPPEGGRRARTLRTPTMSASLPCSGKQTRRSSPRGHRTARSRPRARRRPSGSLAGIREGAGRRARDPCHNRGRRQDREGRQEQDQRRQPLPGRTQDQQEERGGRG